MSESQIFRVEVWPIGRLIPYAKNPRHTTEAAIDAVAESLSRFGWQQPIVATIGGMLVAGHTRYRAAQKLEMPHVPVQVIPDEDAAAYRLIDNRTGDLTTWDLDLLPAELEAVSDLEAFDFAALFPPENVGQTDPDDVPEPPPASTKITKSGDIWELGKHRLICGDSTDPRSRRRFSISHRGTSRSTRPLVLHRASRRREILGADSAMRAGAAVAFFGWRPNPGLPERARDCSGARFRDRALMVFTPRPVCQ